MENRLEKKLSVVLQNECNGGQQKVERLTPGITIGDLILKKRNALKFSDEEKNLTARRSDGSILHPSYPLSLSDDGSIIIIQNEVTTSVTEKTTLTEEESSGDAPRKDECAGGSLLTSGTRETNTSAPAQTSYEKIFEEKDEEKQRERSVGNDTESDSDSKDETPTGELGNVPDVHNKSVVEEKKQPKTNEKAGNRKATTGLICVISILLAALGLNSDTYQRTTTVVNIQRGLCLKYEESYTKIPLEPWKTEEQRGESLDDFYVSQKFRLKDEFFSSLLQLYNWDPSNLRGKRKVLIGEQGMGKTTAMLAMTQEWCRQKGGFFAQLLEEILPKTVRNKLKLTELPTFVIALDIRDTLNKQSFQEIITSYFPHILNGITREKLDEIIKAETHRTFLYLDGYDEYSKLGGSSPELDRIITREAYKTINLLISTRPWKVNSLGTDFQRVHIQELDEDSGMKFITGFFSSKELGNLFFDDLKSHKPSERLWRHPRMLLYLCNMWKKDRTVFQTWSQEEFWQELWSYMRLTYNNKYPDRPMSKDQMKETVTKIEEFVSTQHDQSRENFEQFFDEAGFDLFYFGIYSLETRKGRKIDDEDIEVVFLPHQEAFNHGEPRENSKEETKESKGFFSW